MSTPIEVGEVSKILGWEKNIDNYVLDPIYGPIGLTSSEFELTGTEVFTRLRNIKQLGFVSNIYPSATHTRFEHSLGTLLITWDVLKRLLRKFEENSEKDIIELFTDDVIESLRLAALLHDLGHGPFSHSLETALSYLGMKFDHDDLTSYLLSFELKNDCASKSTDSSNQFDALKNEKLLRFRNDLKRLLRPELRTLVLSILEPSFESPAIPESFEKIRFFLHDMIKGDIGSDRIDYLLRDTYFTGLGHRFSLSEMLDNLYYVVDKNNDRLILSIKSEGKAALELMLLTRYFHYQFIAHHPKNVTLTAILQRRIKDYLEKNAKIGSDEEKRKLILDIALSNDWIEKDLPPPLSFSPVYRVSLLDFQDLRSRFLFYRVIEDDKLRPAFQSAIERYILEKHEIDVTNRILFNFTVEQPRIPILPFHLDQYKIGPVKRSVLVHDNSPFLLGLGRAYIENSSMTIYAQSDLAGKLKEMFFSDPDFYRSPTFLGEIIKKINLASMNVHDYLLFMITSLSKDTEERTVKHFGEITEEYKRIKRKEQAEYDYPKYEKCYDCETKRSFDYPDWLFNALILFDVCKLLDIELVTSPYAEDGGGKLFKPSYNFKVRSYPIPKVPSKRYIPLYLTIRNYQETVARFFDLDLRISAAV